VSFGTVCQVIDTLAPGWAVSNCLLSAQEVLAEAGYRATVRARVKLGALNGGPRCRRFRRDRLLLYHFSVGSSMSSWVEQRARREPVVLWYHNLTPAHYFGATDPFMAGRLVAGREELARLAPICHGALADSEYNAAEMRELGYENVQVVPPIFFDGRYDLPPTPGIMDKARPDGATWLYVGRLVPNKRQDEVIAAFEAYRRLDPGAQLFLVGTEGTAVAYRRWLENQIAYLGLQDAVHLVGHVSQNDVNAYYRIADLYVSMSEHEGFGVPLIECMYFDVPFIAYAASAVTETAGEAGILMTEQHPYLVAEMAALLRADDELRQAVLRRQRRELARFSLAETGKRLLDAIAWFEGPAG
jgi:L-malate glycosyltransferase